jgi:hypothetical protein
MATEPITIAQGQLRLPRFFLLAANLRRSDTVAGTIRSSLSLSGVVVGPLPALPLLIFAGLLPIRPISLQRLEVFARVWPVRRTRHTVPVAGNAKGEHSRGEATGRALARRRRKRAGAMTPTPKATTW